MAEADIHFPNHCHLYGNIKHRHNGGKPSLWLRMSSILSETRHILPRGMNYCPSYCLRGRPWGITYIWTNAYLFQSIILYIITQPWDACVMKSPKGCWQALRKFAAHQHEYISGRCLQILAQVNLRSCEVLTPAESHGINAILGVVVGIIKPNVTQERHLSRYQAV